MNDESEERIKANKRSEKLVKEILLFEKKLEIFYEHSREHIKARKLAEKLVEAILSSEKFKNKNQRGFFSYKGDSDIDLDRFLIGLIHFLSSGYYYTDPCLDLIDNVQECSIALERSLDKFDPEMGYELPIYVNWWIVHGLKRAIDREKANQSS